MNDIKWVPVSERLPCNSDPVPVKYPSIGWGFIVASWSEARQEWLLEWPTNLIFDSKYVTEWLEL